MTTNLHPSELSDHLVYRLRSGATMWGATLLAFTLALGSLAIDETHSDRRAHWLRTGLLTGGVAAAALAFLARENVVQRSLISPRCHRHQRRQPPAALLRGHETRGRHPHPRAADRTLEPQPVRLGPIGHRGR
jgi:hypothetical protein